MKKEDENDDDHHHCRIRNDVMIVSIRSVTFNTFLFSLFNASSTLLSILLCLVLLFCFLRSYSIFLLLSIVLAVLFSFSFYLILNFLFFSSYFPLFNQVVLDCLYMFFLLYLFNSLAIVVSQSV